MRHSKQLKSSSTLSLSREDLFSTAGGDRGDVGPSSTYLFSRKLVLEEIGIMRDFSHLSIILQY